MNQIASREILWNVSNIANVIGMYGLLAVALLVASVGVVRHAELWLSGKPAPERSGFWVIRFFDLVDWALLQRGVVRERFAAIAHSFIYFGFMVLLFTTTMVFLDHDLGIRIYNGDFYLAVTLMSDVLGAGVLIGCALAAHRRYIQRPDLIHNQAADGIALIVLALLVVQGFTLEALRIHVTQDQWRLYSPIGFIFSKVFWPLSPSSASLLHFIVWWFHTITVMTVIALFPYTKFFHVLVSSANLFFRYSGRPRGALESPGDIAQLMETSEDLTLGLGSIRDYTWKQLLDLDSCTSCGRCQDNCPAYLSGTPLSPKWLILDSRNHALALNAQGKLGKSVLPGQLACLDAGLTNSLYFSNSGVVPAADGQSYTAHGSWRGKNQKVQDSVIALGKNADDRIAGEVLDADVFWSCTTCGACVEVCPVGINHVDQIVGNRRNMVLMQGEIPTEAQATLRSLENQANPFGAPEDRIKWLSGLNVKILKPGDSVDYLYWVGCVSAYDPRKQKIARALVTLMNHAGLSFGILGSVEGCSGDPARRLGEENLYQTLAKSNIENLTKIKFKSLVANCPHCFNTIKNEYPQFGNLDGGRKAEIIHHSQLLKRLLDQGRLKLKDDADQSTWTFHDPCYLGRYNDEYDAPREVLKAKKSLNVVEMDRSREKGMCCGAGGGHFWMDIKTGDKRVNSMRADQAAATGATKIATACPFCMQMMEDGVKLTNREETMVVKDIAEVLADSLAAGD